MRFAQGRADTREKRRIPSPSMGEGYGGGDQLTRVSPLPHSSPARGEE
jgi:hypothetical protein